MNYHHVWKILSKPWLWAMVAMLVVLLGASLAQAAIPPADVELAPPAMPLAGNNQPGTPDNACIRVAGGLGTGNVCTAGDVRVGAMTVVGESITCEPDQMVKATQRQVESGPESMILVSGSAKALALVDNPTAIATPASCLA
jgi:hypothetical protein